MVMNVIQTLKGGTFSYCYPKYHSVQNLDYRSVDKSIFTYIIYHAS